MEHSSYHGVDLAPYYRFRPTPFYGEVFVNGTYTADIAGCNWTCDNCWSKFGWRGLDVNRMPKGSGEFTSEQVVRKLVAGMRRNGMPMARISGGEATMYWDPHMVEVIRGLLAETRGERVRIRGKTPRHGVDMGLCIETNGSMLKVDDLEGLENELGEEARRLVVAVGVKATNAVELGRLTGMTPATSERFHDRQMQLLRWLATKAKHIGYFANFIDEFTEESEYAELIREFERRSPGAARLFGVDPYRKGYGSTKHYTPKRDRERLEREPLLDLTPSNGRSLSRRRRRLGT